MAQAVFSRVPKDTVINGPRPLFAAQGLKPVKFISFRHGSRRALIQGLFSQSPALWKCNLA
jgi:hypothetical protein